MEEPTTQLDSTIEQAVTFSQNAIQQLKDKIRLQKEAESLSKNRQDFPSIFNFNVTPNTPLFNGQRFILYAFDVTNLIVSFQKRSGNSFSHLSPLPEIKRKCFRQVKYMAYWFTSRNFAWSVREIPEDRQNRWYIETRIKVNAINKYIDIDTALTSVISPFLDAYHSQISAFCLGSGDKDLAILFDKALAYNIPCYIIGIDMNHISRDLLALAKGKYLMFRQTNPINGTIPKNIINDKS